MAKLPDSITMAVESAVHGALRDLAQAVWDKHHICLQTVRLSWRDESTTEEYRLIVSGVEANTLTKA